MSDTGMKIGAVIGAVIGFVWAVSEPTSNLVGAVLAGVAVCGLIGYVIDNWGNA